MGFARAEAIRHPPTGGGGERRQFRASVGIGAAQDKNPTPATRIISNF